MDKWQSRRKEIAEHWRSRSKYKVLIKDIDTHALQKFVIQTPERDKLREEWDIPTRINYPYTFAPFPNATKLSKEVLSLPLYPELTDGEVEYISSLIS